MADVPNILTHTGGNVPEPTTAEMVLECEWLALLLSTAPRKKSLRPVRDALDAAFPVQGLRDRAKLAAALHSFYELPEARQRLVLNGWSPVPNRPTLQQLCDRMLDEGHHVQRCLVIAAPPAAWREAGAAAVHSFRPAGCHSAVRVEITEGATRADVLAGLQHVAAAVVDQWDELIDHRKIKGVGEAFAGVSASVRQIE